MSDLADFLLARIAEDEQAANDAAHYLGKYGRPDDEQWVVRQDESCSHDTGTGVWVLDSGRAGGRSEVVANIDSPHVAAHIARHDPARVLAECKAKRELLAMADPYDFADDGGTGMSEHADKIRGLLALPYADHPDYREEWRP